MSQGPRILNISCGSHLKRSQVDRAIENRSLVWVEYGKTVRKATYEEAMAMRKAQEIQPLGLSYFVEGLDKDGMPTLIPKPYLAELHETTFEHSGHETEIYREMQLVQEANRYAAEHV